MGIEPTRHSCHRILSPMRLPVPPRPHVVGGSIRIRTGDHRVAVYCLSHLAMEPSSFRLLLYYTKEMR